MASLQWHYLDSQGTEFGPFDGQKMRSWFEQGFFQVAGDNLLVKLADWKGHKRLCEVYAGDKASYFIAPPKHGEDADSAGRERSRSPRGRQDGAGGGLYQQQAGQYPPQAGGYPGHYPSPAGYPGYPGHYAAQAHGWGAPPPHGPGPWGPNPYMGGPHHPYGCGWGAPPQPGPHMGGGYGYWDPYGRPPPPPHRSLQDFRSPSRSRSPRGGGRPRRDSADDRARQHEEQQAELRRLGRDGLRELLSSTLESLYKDRIKPMANYVKGRLKERSAPEAVMKQYVDLYGEHKDLFRVERAQSVDEAVVYMANEPAWFKGWVDIDSSDDPYEESFWKDLEKFLDDGHTFAGGRYGMARELSQRSLPCLAPFTLGEICHIVQLSIQKRKIIVYHKKMLKRMQPNLNHPAPANGNGGDKSESREVTEIPDLCKVLFKTLRVHPQGIRLDRLRQMIKEECNCRLNEMAFQCTKLIDLFRQDPLKSTFTLEKDGNVFYVRAGSPRNFTDEIRRIYEDVSTGKSA